MKSQAKPLIAGIALGAIVLGSIGITGASANNLPRPEASQQVRAAQTDIGSMTPLSGLKSYKYTLDIRASGSEARYTLEDYYYLGVPEGDQLTLSVKGVVVGGNAHTTLTLNGAKEVDYRNGDRFESKVNGDPLEKWAGPFDDGDFDDTSLYAAQQYWDEALMPWFEANRSNFVCSTAASPFGVETRDCTFDGLDETALYDLLDAVSYGSFDEFTKLDVRATFSAQINAPTSVSIIATGADELGGSTTFELTMKLSDVNSSSLALPPAPSAR